MFAVAPAFLLLSLATHASANPNQGLVARYSFESLRDGVLEDSSGRGNDLRAVGQVSLQSGKVGQAVLIGPGGYAQAPKTDSLELGSEMTLEAWIKPSANPPSGMRIVDRATIGGNDGFMFDTWPEGHLRLIIAPGLVRAPDPISVGEWTHVAATYSKTTGELRLYMNGKIVAEGYGGGDLRSSDHPLNLGASQGGGDRFQGLIDEVRLYARALAPEEIMAHYEGREIEPPAEPGHDPLPVLVRGDQPQVDYAALCARNDLVYRQPALYPYEAMHLGNGNLGVCLWNDGGMVWQLNNGRYRIGNEPLSSGKVTLSTPALNERQPRHFEQRVNLWDGTVTTMALGPAGNADATSFVAEGDDLLVCRCREIGAGPRELTLHLWPSRTAAHFVQGSDTIALTEHTDHAEPYLATDMALAVRVDGAQVKSAKRDDRTLVLTFVNAPRDYTVYVANALTRTGEDEALKTALAVIDRARAKGYDTLLAERRAFWHRFWPQSFLHITSPTGEGDFLENLWYLFFYDLASMSRNTLCPKFNGGNWLVQEDSRWWGGGYWHQNTREIFWPTYAAGHVELSDPFFELYGRAAAVARQSGRVGLNTDGYYIPEWIPINVGPLGGPKDFKHPGYTAFVFTVGLEVSLQAWWRYEFTGDERFLREVAYPLLKGSLDFYLNYAKKGADGKYHLEPADAQESYWLVRDPAQDLAALRWGLPVALRVSEKLGLDADLRPRWQDLLDNLAPFAVDPAKKMLREADLPPDAERHNSENVADYAIYPFGVFGIGLPDIDLAQSTFRQRPVPGMGNGWEPAAIAAARLGLGEEAANLELGHLLSNLRSNNGGWYSPTGDMFVDNIPDVPYYDSAGVSAQALQEMALQSHAGVIRIAPAWPTRWQAQFRLHARGGFVVTAETHQGQARYALIESQWGGPCAVANPWSEMALVTCGGKPILRSAGPVLRFATEKGRTYRLERVAQPVAQMAFAPLKPAANDGPKFIGRRLPAWPNWNNPAYLGIDAQGRAPKRAVMERNVAALRERLAKATAGLTDLSTSRATAKIVAGDGKESEVAAAVDGKIGPTATVDVPSGQTLVLDLGAEKTVQAIVLSRDRTGLRVDGPIHGYTWEVSANGKDWTVVLDAAKRRAAAIGQVDTFNPTTARYLRLRPTGRYGQGTILDEVIVYGK